MPSPGVRNAHTRAMAAVISPPLGAQVCLCLPWLVWLGRDWVVRAEGRWEVSTHDRKTSVRKGNLPAKIARCFRK